MNLSFVALTVNGELVAPIVNGELVARVVKSDVDRMTRNWENTCCICKYKPMNCTAVTLVPKVANACKVKDFRPIVCCSVMYNIISKILTNRLQDVIGEVVCDAQSGFYS